VQIENLKSAEHAACRRVSGDDRGLAAESDVAGGAQRLERVGHGERKCRKGVAIDAGLGVR
jgi:hypothetical protein